MKGLEFSGDGWVVQGAYLCESGAPNYTTLCELFWRCVLLTPGQCLTIAILVSVIMVGPPAIIVWIGWMTIGAPLSVMVIAPTVALLTVNIWHEGSRERMSESMRRIEPRIEAALEPIELFAGMAVAVKKKMCPIVQIK